MSLMTIYETPEEARNAPCPICGLPNREHPQQVALDCFGQILRHPDADADDILALVTGALWGVVFQSNFRDMYLEAQRLANLMTDAWEDRQKSKPHVHRWALLRVWEAERQDAGTVSGMIGCRGCETAYVSLMMEPCPWPEPPRNTNYAEPTDRQETTP